MKNSRRRFIHRTTFAAGSFLLLPASGVSLAATLFDSGGKQTPEPADLDRADRDVLRFVSRYSDRVSFAPDRRGCRTIVAEMGSSEKFIRTFRDPRGLPFEGVQAEGNTLSFTHKGTAFTLQNAVA